MSVLDDIDLEEAVKLRDTYKAELSLHEFLKQAWRVMEGDKSFVDGWHLEAICEHLEAISNRDIRNLIINMPPRCCKSSIVSVAFPAWLWLHNPNEQFLYASYALSLSLRDSVKCRRLILSPWYQERWGHRFKLLPDQNTKGRFDNTRKGYRIAASAGSSVTGEGGSILVCDDPNNALDLDSEATRENTLEWYSQVWSTRLNDRTKDCKIIIQQRIHELDVTGFILDSEPDEWVKLILPMEFEKSRKSVTIKLPSIGDTVWEDPRTEEGEILWPERYTAKDLDKLKVTLGSYAYAGQFQQRPSPAEGGIIKKDWWRWWKSPQIPALEFTLQSWDTAYSAGKDACYSACTTWGVFYDENYIANAILLSMWRGRVEYVELRDRAKRLYFDYRDTGKERHPSFTGRPLDVCLIEAKASGDPLMKDLALAGIIATPINPRRQDDKKKRVYIITNIIESGRLWLPARAPHYDHLLPFADEFRELTARFPNTESDDVVDTMSQAIMYLKDRLFLYNPKDERRQEEHRKVGRVY